MEASRKRSGDSDLPEKAKKLKKDKRSKKKRRKKHSSPSNNSSSENDDLNSSDSERLRKKHKKKSKKKRKHERKEKRKKMKKSKHSEESVKNTEVITADGQKDPEMGLKEMGPSVEDARKAMAPMTKEEWEKQQSVIRRVYDPETGRNRLIKGDGEVLEEIVSKERHKEINKAATIKDGEHFQKKAGFLK